MNKKIMMLGVFNDVYRSINDFLSEDYQVQMCPFDLTSVRGMSKIAKPDLFLLYMGDAEIDSKNLFDYLNQDWGSTPIIVIDMEENYKKYSYLCEGERIAVLFRPVNNYDILKKCKSLLAGKAEIKSNEESSEAEEENIEDLVFRPFESYMVRAEKKKILVVDDAALMLRAINELLKDRYEVSFAKSGKQALESVEMNPPDLILLDYNMPGMDGKETFLKIREMYGDSIPVIFLTGVAEKKKIVDVIKDKPAGYVLKPPDSGQLVGKIEAALAGRFNW